MWYIALGFVLTLAAAVLETYCDFGRQASSKYRPKIFFNPTYRIFLQAGWIVLLLAGGVLLLMYHWILAVAGIIGFWLFIPLWILPIIRGRLLPPWDKLKDDLEKLGYTRMNYLFGDWWKDEKYRKKKKKEPQKSSDSKETALVQRPKDYYQILEVPKNASEDDIKKAYRKLVKKYHPDRNPREEKWANEKLKEINEAYGVLGNPENRKRYDQFGMVGNIDDA